MKNDLVRKSGKLVKRNASTILTVMGGAGVVVTAVLTAKATPKALMLLEQAKEEKQEELTKFEKVKAAGPAYIPAVLVGAGTIACIFGANILNKKQQAALMSAYALVDNSYKEYQAKVKEKYGEEGDAEIRTEIANDKFKEEPKQPEDDGKKLFFDEYSNTFFRATNEEVLRAEYLLNREVTSNYYATLNELREMLGMPKTDYGDTVGWSSAQMYDMYWECWIEFEHEKVEAEDGTEYFILRYTEPCPEFEDY